MSSGAAILGIVSVLKWPVLGGLFAGGAILAGRWAAPRYLTSTARDLGQEAGAGFAEGVVEFNRMIERTSAATPFVGRWAGVMPHVRSSAR